MSRLVDSKMGHGPGTFILQDHRSKEKIENRAFLQGARITGRLNDTSQLGHWLHDHESVGDIQGALLWHNETRPIPSWRFAWPVISEQPSESESSIIDFTPIGNAEYAPDRRFASQDINSLPQWNKIPGGYVGISLVSTEEDKQTDLFFPTDRRLVASHRDSISFSTPVADVQNGQMGVQAGLHTLAFVVEKPQENVLAIPVTKDYGYIWDKKRIGALSWENGGLLTTGQDRDKHPDTAHLWTGGLFTDHNNRDGPLDFEDVPYSEPDSLPFTTKGHLRFDGKKWRIETESAWYIEKKDKTKITNIHEQKEIISTNYEQITTQLTFRPRKYNWDSKFLQGPKPCQTPLTSRLEPFYTQKNRNTTYTELPTASKYKCGTGPGGLMVLPPELNMQDVYEYYTQTDGFVSCGAQYDYPTHSETYFMATGDSDTFFASAVPDFERGGVRIGWRWRWDATDKKFEYEFFEDNTKKTVFEIFDNGSQLFWGNLIAGSAAVQFTHVNTTARAYSFPDATGTIVLHNATQTLSNKTLTTPTIGDFTNATHSHETVVGGGTLNAAAIAAGTLPVARGGTNAGAFTAGSIVFAGTGGTYTQNNANLFWDNTNYRLGIGESAPATDIDLTKTVAGGNVQARVRNSDNTNASSVGRFLIQVGGTSAGDAYLLFEIGGTTSWAVGIDNSDADKFKVSQSATLGTTDRFVIDTTGKVGIGEATPTTGLHIKQQNVAFRGQLTIEATDFAQISLYGGPTTQTNSKSRLYYDVAGNEMNFQNDVSGSPFIFTGGAVRADANKTRDLGTSTVRWNTLYQGTSTAAGTSRIVQTSIVCKDCNKSMWKSTGGVRKLGADFDFEEVYCFDCGRVGLETYKHYQLDREIKRKPAPKIVFKGFHIDKYSGNSRYVRVDFLYGKDKKGKDICNSTYLQEKEYAEFLEMTIDQQKAFLKDLGQREWDALEDDRLMDESIDKTKADLKIIEDRMRKTDLLTGEIEAELPQPKLFILE